jgi:mRNA interferase MazF
MKHGEIRWYKFQRPDEKRPALVLTRDSVLEYLGEVTIAPITSTIRNIPSEVLLSEADGMPQECAVNWDHLQTVSKKKLGALITYLPPAKISMVSQAIRFALDI